MSRRAFLVIAFLAVMTMCGGAGAGMLLGRAEDARQVAAVQASGRTADGRLVTSNSLSARPA
jgi:hypothetical protein